MEISDIRIRRVQGKERLKAYASVAFDNEFVVHNIKVIETPEGSLFIAMPSRVSPDGSFKDIAHPISQDFRDKLSSAVLKVFSELD